MKPAAILAVSILAGLISVEYVALGLAVFAIALATLALGRVNDAVRGLEEVTSHQATAAEELLSSAQTVDDRIRHARDH